MPVLPLEDHLARLKLGDLFLDTLVSNAHTTASDALWAGVPVLTCTGEAFASRMAGSLLRTVGLSELITHSLPDYERLALELCRQPQRLRQLREHLETARDRAALFDTAGYCRHLEAAYTAMHRAVLYGHTTAASRLPAGTNVSSWTARISGPGDTGSRMTALMGYFAVSL